VPISRRCDCLSLATGRRRHEAFQRNGGRAKPDGEALP
jgi:hypothetical protein